MAINYEPVGWDTTKYFNPTNMNHMDDGIKSACDNADSNKESIADVNSKLGNTDISAIGDGTVTGGLNALNSNLNGLLKVNTKTMTANVSNYIAFAPNEFVLRAYIDDDWAKSLNFKQRASGSLSRSYNDSNDKVVILTANTSYKVTYYYIEIQNS